MRRAAMGKACAVAGALGGLLALASAALADEFEWPKRPTDVFLFATGQPAQKVTARKLPDGALSLRTPRGELGIGVEKILGWYPIGQPASVQFRPGVRTRFRLKDGSTPLFLVRRADPKVVEAYGLSGDVTVARDQIGEVMLIEAVPETPCEWCRGLGVRPEARACATCGGKGRTPCQACLDGENYPCPEHQGSACPLCLGSGQVRVLSCNECGGSGERQVWRRVSGGLKETTEPCGPCRGKGVRICGK